MDVTNQGTGKALDAVGSIKNAADQNVFIEKGRFHLGEIAPGETQTARFQLEVKKGYVGDSFPLKLAVIDEPLEEFSTERLNLPLADKPFTIEARKGNVRVETGAPVLAGPDDRAPVMARVKKAGVLPVLGRVNGLTKVETEKGRFGFLRASDAHEARNAKAAAPELAAAPYREPPRDRASSGPEPGRRGRSPGPLHPLGDGGRAEGAPGHVRPGQRPEGILPHLGQPEERAHQAEVHH